MSKYELIGLAVGGPGSIILVVSYFWVLPSLFRGGFLWGLSGLVFLASACGGAALFVLDRGQPTHYYALVGLAAFSLFNIAFWASKEWWRRKGPVLWGGVGLVMTGIGGLVATKAIDERRERQAIERVEAQLQTLETALMNHDKKYGRYPSNEEGMNVLVELGFLASIEADPWGTDFDYEEHGGAKKPWYFTVLSAGPDRRVGTEDDLKNPLSRLAADAPELAKLERMKAPPLIRPTCPTGVKLGTIPVGDTVIQACESQSQPGTYENIVEKTATGRREYERVDAKGTPTGKVVEFGANDGKVQETVWADGVKKSTVRFHPDGKKASERSFKGDKEHGKKVAWYETGKVRLVEYLELGVKSGSHTAYHPNGKKHIRANYENGELDGAFTEWHPNGKKAVQAKYRRGELNGLRVEWDASGKKTSSQLYRDNNPVLE